MAKCSPTNIASTTNATIGNVAFQVMAGLALICSGVGLGVLLFRRAPVVATAGGVLMAAAGVLTLMNSAVYAAMAELARDYVDGNSTDASLEAARSLGLVLSASTNAVGVALVVATGSFAIAISRARLVPRWVALLPLGAIALTVAGTIAAVITGWSLGWAIFFGIFIVSVFWFLFVGGMLLFGRDRSLVQPPVSPA